MTLPDPPPTENATIPDAPVPDAPTDDSPIEGGPIGDASGDEIAVPPRSRRRTGLWVGLGIGVVVAAALAVTGGVVWSTAEAERVLEEAQQVSPVEQSIIDAEVGAASDLADRIGAQRALYRDAETLWDFSEDDVEKMRAEAAVPTVEVPNPGGEGMPGGDGAARALLDSIGGSDVQLVFDAGEQNCGYAPAGPGMLAFGGCYNTAFPDTLFLAWDPGIDADGIWSVFVHEAMHWYQEELYGVMFQAAQRSGVEPDAYRSALESDASCRAVVVHGVPRSAYEGSSAPCDVDGWTENWFAEQLVALGVPSGPPDPAAFEVEAVVRP